MADIYLTLLLKLKSDKTALYLFKPTLHLIDINQKMSRTNVESELLIVKKDNRNQLDKQIYNIALNIVFNFFSLSNLKFYAIILRCKLWGLPVCILLFIMHYYLYLKTDNRLRQFVMLHFNKVAMIVCNIILMQLIDKLNLQTFKSSLILLKTLKQKLALTLKLLVDTIPLDDIKKKVVEPILSKDDAAKLKELILADLKADNKEILSI